jgi:MFS family permease
LYYAFPVMLVSVTRATGWSTVVLMSAFSLGAITSALAGVVVGRLIDARGPRTVMTCGSILGALAVAAIALSPTLWCFFAAWVLAGLAQAGVLYPPAFAAITGWYGPDRVRALTTLAAAAGFASTVFAPLTAVLLDHLSWRGVYLVLAAILAVVTIPLHWWYLTPAWKPARATRTGRGAPAAPPGVLTSHSFILLAAAMAVAAFGMYAATVNLVPLLDFRGMDHHLAAITLGLCGAGQVLGRVGYPRLATRIGPRTRTVAVLIGGALTVIALGVLPGPAAVLVVVAVLAGAVRGVFTLLQATAVSDRWGTAGFGRINGVFIAPITIAIALAPGGGALLEDLAGTYPASYTLLALATITAAVATVVADHRRNSPVTDPLPHRAS